MNNKSKNLFQIKMKDFTLTMFNQLLIELLNVGYGFVTFEEYIQKPKYTGKIIILRHDVDKKPLRSLRTAKMENKLKIRGTYYFRVIKNKSPKEIIKKIVKLGHEIGYHYDDLNAADGIVEHAQKLFQNNLTKLRELVPVKTACMHGSPLSMHDNRAMWESRTYREFGIIGEPYFDVDFTEVLYLTDTGRKWNGDRFSVRDRVASANSVSHQYDFNDTQNIINAIKAGTFPHKAMLTFHPQRWTDDWIPWTIELLGQKIKNFVKYFVAKRSR